LHDGLRASRNATRMRAGRLNPIGPGGRKVLQQPEAYLGGLDKLLDERGGIANDSTRGFLVQYLSAFAAWIDRNLAR
jgi:hypothetical protein